MAEAKQDVLNINNICKGAVPEVFARDSKGNVDAYPHDPRQVAMFAAGETNSPKQ